MGADCDRRRLAYKSLNGTLLDAAITQLNLWHVLYVCMTVEASDGFLFFAFCVFLSQVAYLVALVRSPCDTARYNSTHAFQQLN